MTAPTMRHDGTVARAAALLLALAAAAGGQQVEYPPNAGQFNVRDFGARGDGRTDDTQAFRKAIRAVKMHFQIIYVPDGTYLVGDTVYWDAWITLQGQSRDGTIIRLKDKCPGFQGGGKPVLRCMFNNNMSFSNYIRHLTVDAGRGNAGAIGIRYNTHNHGVLEHVTIRSGDGAGRVGLDLGETEFGPGMVRHVAVEGFDVGVKTPANVSHATLEDIALRNQRLVGLDSSFPISIRGLTSVNRVPAVRNAAHPLALLVLIDADLSGGSPTAPAIESKGRYYLRNITASGYRAVLSDAGALVAGGRIDERIGGDLLSVFPSPPRHLNLPVKEPPRTFEEPAANWVIPDGSAEDDTAAVQKAIDSGASTICLPANVQYMISDTIIIRGAVRRVIALKHHHGNLRARNPDAFADRPMVRVEGKGDGPAVTLESVGVSCWPKDSYAIVELATTRPTYLKYVWCGGIRTAGGAAGDLFIDECGADLRIAPGQSVWIRQHNPENNPFDPRKPRFPRTYVVNRGGNLWILGLKTEAPAVHIITTEGGKTEVLGGFFRDHFGPQEYAWQGEPPLPVAAMDRGVPYFITQDASITASYLQYAWTGGKARSLQAVEIRKGQRKDLTTAPDTLTVGLYAGAPAPAERPKP